MHVHNTNNILAIAGGVALCWNIGIGIETGETSVYILIFMTYSSPLNFHRFILTLSPVTVR